MPAETRYFHNQSSYFYISFLTGFYGYRIFLLLSGKQYGHIFHISHKALFSQQLPLPSFIMVEKIGNGKIYDTRLSNGPIESLNRKVKDLKRLGRGFRNFEHFRNRFLYATRALPVLNGVSDYNHVSYLENDEF